MKKSVLRVSSQPNPDLQERFIDHLTQEIERLHSIIQLLVPKSTPRVLFDPTELGTNKMDVFAEDPLQVEQFYKDLGVPKGELDNQNAR